MLRELRQATVAANQRLVREGLVRLTWGNVSCRAADGEHFAIKPSGMAYDELTPDDIVVVDGDGNVVHGHRRPSSDTATHAAIYRAFPVIGGIVHVHSPFATAFAQARRELPPLGTTHADHFAGPVRVTRPVTAEEAGADYVANTGRLIVEHVITHPGSDVTIPAVLVAGHGPFVWGPDADRAVDNAVALEECARIATTTLALAPDAPDLEDWVLTTHYQRKHGPAAGYGQEL